MEKNEIAKTLIELFANYKNLSEKQSHILKPEYAVAVAEAILLIGKTTEE